MEYHRFHSVLSFQIPRCFSFACVLWGVYIWLGAEAICQPNHDVCSFFIKNSLFFSNQLDRPLVLGCFIIITPSDHALQWIIHSPCISESSVRLRVSSVCEELRYGGFFFLLFFVFVYSYILYSSSYTWGKRYKPVLQNTIFVLLSRCLHVTSQWIII